jgi:hypothetical protein
MSDDPKPSDPFAEITAMQKVAEAFKALDQAAVGRVLQWAANHWGTSIASTAKVNAPSVATDALPTSAPQSPYSDLGELFAAAAPQSDADKVLVVSYWLQFIEGNNELSGFEVNKELRNMGYGVGNVTTAFDTLKARKPAPVIQLKKSGTSKQARKSYKLTIAGRQAVEAMLPRQ